MTFFTVVGTRSCLVAIEDAVDAESGPLALVEDSETETEVLTGTAAVGD